MNKQLEKTEMLIAAELGRVAFANGIKHLTLDPAMREMIKGRKVGESVHILTAWNAGWTAANLAN